MYLHVSVWLDLWKQLVGARSSYALYIHIIQFTMQRADVVSIDCIHEI